MGEISTCVSVMTGVENACKLYIKSPLAQTERFSEAVLFFREFEEIDKMEAY